MRSLRCIRLHTIDDDSFLLAAKTLDQLVAAGSAINRLDVIRKCALLQVPHDMNADTFIGEEKIAEA